MSADPSVDRNELVRSESPDLPPCTPGFGAYYCTYWYVPVLGIDTEGLAASYKAKDTLRSARFTITNPYEDDGGNGQRDREDHVGPSTRPMRHNSCCCPAGKRREKRH